MPPVLDQDMSQKGCRAYVRWKIRTHVSLTYQCRQVAQQEGWETADLLRALILLSTTLKFLSLPGNERFQKQVELRRIAGKRAYSPRIGGGHTELLSVRLPQGLSHLITVYAELTGRSRNELVVWLLETGLLIHLKAENAFLEAVRSVKSAVP